MRLISSAATEPLYSVAATRQLEQAAAAALPPHTLMQRAGLSIARLTLALAPHAQKIWIACGPGNNGGDGFEAALHLHQWGKPVILTWTGPVPGRALPADADASRARALAAGVPLQDQPPADFDVCIDALLGLGARPGTASTDGHLQHWLHLMHASEALRLSVDVPTGLNADTGEAAPFPVGAHPAARRVTLSLLTLKPGLFTARGRDSAGQVWFEDLGVATAGTAPTALLLGADRAGQAPRASAFHASHKGSFGDVAVLGGESAAHGHMSGAALLAARAALHAGAGRVMVALLGSPTMTVDVQQPELMFRSPDALDLLRQVLVCGCGGGDAVRHILPKVLSNATRLVLDADALNAIAADTALQTQLKARQSRGHQTVLTPHPLEAARLLGTQAAAIQADRLDAARRLSDQFGVVVVLKGSGTVIAAPGQPLMVNSSGNALLATAGTGDVLAGMVGAFMAGGLNAVDAAARAVFTHGALADDWALTRPGEAFTASTLASGRARA